ARTRDAGSRRGGSGARKCGGESAGWRAGRDFAASLSGTDWVSLVSRRSRGGDRFATLTRVAPGSTDQFRYSPSTMTTKLRDVQRVGLVFSGGPAPGANAVIAAAASSFVEDGREVVGFFHGYSNLQDYHPVTRRLLPDEHYRIFEPRDFSG